MVLVLVAVVAVVLAPTGMVGLPDTVEVLGFSGRGLMELLWEAAPIGAKLAIPEVVVQELIMVAGLEDRLGTTQP